MMLDNIALELPPQDINDFKLIILDEAGNGIGSAKFSLEICIQEIDNEIMLGLAIVIIALLIYFGINEK